MKHSSLPWVILKGMTGAKVHFGRDLDCGDDESLGSCCYQGSRPYDAHLRDQEEANAAFIVKAVNNFDQLLHALDRIRRTGFNGTEEEAPHKIAAEAIKQAEAE